MVARRSLSPFSQSSSASVLFASIHITNALYRPSGVISSMIGIIVLASASSDMVFVNASFWIQGLFGFTRVSGMLNCVWPFELVVGSSL